MATKKYEGMRIMSLEGSVLYKNEGFSATKNGKLNPGAFRGVLDESLDTLKLAEVYDQHEREIGYPYLDGKKRFCRAVVNLSFNRAVKVYESYGNRYVLNGYRVTDEDIYHVHPLSSAVKNLNRDIIFRSRPSNRESHRTPRYSCNPA